MRGLLALTLSAALVAVGCGGAIPSTQEDRAGPHDAVATPPPRTPAGGAARTVPPFTGTPSPSGGTQPPVGFTVVITASRLGFVSAATTPTASCRATARLPSGQLIAAPELAAAQVAGATGTVSWTYSLTTTERGTGIHTASCTLGGQTRSTTAAFAVP